MSGLSSAISPCPNDTFIFGALALGLIDPGPFAGGAFDYADVEALNEAAGRGGPDVVKVSAAAAGTLLDRYAVLDAGAALGFGCGPLLLTGEARPLESLGEARIAVPGLATTAAALLRLTGLFRGEFLPMRYDRIMPALASGEIGAGVVIHESRFTYPDYGLTLGLDLGRWWEETTGAPLPLGVILLRRDRLDRAPTVEDWIRASLDFARAHPQALTAFIADKAQEIAPEVIDRHIRMFVTDFSRSLGGVGRSALLRLFSENGRTPEPATVFATAGLER